MSDTTATTAAPCWVENKCAALIARIRRSPFARDCFADARWFAEHDGYAWDVALAMAWGYWGK